MMYYLLIAYVSITNEMIFENFVLSDCPKAELYLRMLAVVLRLFSNVERKINKPAQIQALDEN